MRAGPAMGLLRGFVRVNRLASEAFDRLLPESVRRDGNATFKRLLPTMLRSSTILYDLGGGSQPCVSIEEKRRFALTLVGVDISGDELEKAPRDVYDTKIVADLCQFIGKGDADLVVCQAALEHVPDTPGAMRAIATCLKPGGTAAIFAPCRNAIFARLNRALPEGVKRRILFALFPNKAQGHDGFEAFYDKCTPRDIERLAISNGLVIVHRQVFWMSSYFKVLFPAFLCWRGVQAASRLIWGAQSAETFLYVVVKQ